MNINVGDKVRYTGPSMCDLTHGRVYAVVDAGVWGFDVRDDVDDLSIIVADNYEPVREATKDTPDYNNGEWHGWLGGECPVHPESLVGVKTRDGSECVDQKARLLVWDEDGGGTIIAFRVTKPYVEPKKPREWWIDLDTGKVFPDNEYNVEFFNFKGFIHVREVLDD